MAEWWSVFQSCELIFENDKQEPYLTNKMPAADERRNMLVLGNEILEENSEMNMCSGARSKESPTSPGKKSVRFADHEGKELCSVLIFSHDTDLKEHGHGGRNNHRNGNGNSKKNGANGHKLEGTLNLYFEKLDSQTLIERALTNYVTLDNIVQSERGIIGMVAVKNEAYYKQVTVRYTWNGWKTFQECPANFYQQGPSTLIDKFIFVIPAPKITNSGKGWNLEFAIRYRVAGMEYWDNNAFKNYVVKSDSE